jgi:hypothetical protein
MFVGTDQLLLELFLNNLTTAPELFKVFSFDQL